MAAVLMTGSALIAADWPQWRGPNRDGIAPDSPALIDLADAKQGLPLLWKRANIPSGTDGGFSSVSVAGDKAYVFVNWKRKVAIETRTITPEILQQLGWREKAPAEFARALETARLSPEREALDTKEAKAKDPNGLTTWTKAWLDTNTSTDALKPYREWAANRLRQGKAAIPWDMLEKLATLGGKTFAAQAELDKALADNGIAGDAAQCVVKAVSATATRDEAENTILCLNTADGTIAWEKRYPGKPSQWGSSSTPCISGGRVYVSGGKVVYCHNASDGNLIWQAETKGSSISSSPMLLGDKVIVQAGVLTALGVADGAVAWTQPNVKGSNPSPVAWASGGRSFVIANGGTLSCVDATNGNVVWTVPGGGSGTPVVQGDLVVLFSEGKTPGLVAYKMSPDKAEPAWTVPVGDRGTTPIIYEGHVYAVGASKVMCVRLSDGRVMWEEALHCEITSPLLADGKVIATVAGGGTLMMFQASPEKLNLLGKIHNLAAATCSSPSISAGKLFLRLNDGIACYDLQKR